MTTERMKLADKLTAHVGRLACTPMNLPLSEWNIISNNILSAAAALRAPEADAGAVASRNEITDIICRFVWGQPSAKLPENIVEGNGKIADAILALRPSAVGMGKINRSREHGIKT